MARKSKKNIPFRLIDGENISRHVTSERFKPELWEVRKAFNKLAELLPNSPAVDISTIIKARPFQVDTDIDGIYREQVVPFIMGLYGYLYDHEDEVDTAIVCLMWVVRNAHYHYMGGPVPDQRRKPRRKAVRTDEWKERMVCPLCLKSFELPKEATNITYKQALGMFNTWLKVHAKTCQPDARTRKQLEIWNASKNELMAKQTADTRFGEYTQHQQELVEEATRSAVTPESILDTRIRYIRSAVRVLKGLKGMRAITHYKAMCAYACTNGLNDKNRTLVRIGWDDLPKDVREDFRKELDRLGLNPGLFPK